MKIYTITHKVFKEKIVSDLYQTLLVGADNNLGLPKYLKDNSFPENISYKNNNYCELTGLYWIWKCSRENIVGVCHYRRYFTDGCGNIINDQEQILNLLKKNDIILPKKDLNVFGGLTAKRQFKQCHDIDVWRKCRKIIRQEYPNYYKDFKWFEKQRTGFCFNMMITRKKLFDQYCEWLFSILFKLEKAIDITKYDAYNQRMYGFVSERLLNVWVHHQRLKVKELPVLFINE